MGGAPRKGTHRQKRHIFSILHSQRHPGALTFLDFWAWAAFNPATFSERLSFRTADWSWRPEANARQRYAPSGVKVFGRLPARVSGHPPRRRGIQYSETARPKPRG